jgi:hypothetical protein
MAISRRDVDTLEEPLMLAKVLLESAAAAAYFEVRIILSEGPVVQRFFPVTIVRGTSAWVHELEQFDGEANVYYGVVPRNEQRGTSDGCGPAPAVWADFDDGAPAAIPVAPSLVVKTSPGKYQALWLLATACADHPRIEAINRSIASRYGGDSNACDRARVLRLPGISRNHAYAMARARVYPVIALGRKLVVPKARFLAWLEADGGYAEGTPQADVSNGPPAQRDRQGTLPAASRSGPGGHTFVDLSAQWWELAPGAWWPVCLVVADVWPLHRSSG